MIFRISERGLAKNTAVKAGSRRGDAYTKFNDAGMPAYAMLECVRAPSMICGNKSEM
jgi:hypothetical protein